MSDNQFDAEMQALLSAYAAGTLTKDEQKRLFEKSLNNQVLFNAMADEETMRTTLDSPLVRETLLRTLDQVKAKRGPIELPKSNNWLWSALAACLVVGAATIAYWPTPKPETQVVAIATKPQAISESTPTPAPKPDPKARAIPPPAQAPAVLEESTVAKREAKSVDQPQSSAVADSARQEVTAAAANSFRERNAPNAAKLASAPPPLAAEIFNDNLILHAANGSQIYAFLIDGDSIKSISTANDSRRSLPLGAHTTKAEVWLLITTTEDPVLARALTGVFPLPTRNWIKLKTNP